MRIGKPGTDSRRRWQARKRARHSSAIRHLCDRLDDLVLRAEAMRPWAHGRRQLLARADRVREHLRVLEH